MKPRSRDVPGIVSLVLAVAVSSVALALPFQKRDGPVQVRYTDFAGTTACGESNIDTNNDHVVGLSSDLFGDGSLCGASITVTGPNGQSSTGTIVDSGADQINLSQVMFTEIEGSLDAGVFQGTYEINQSQKREIKKRDGPVQVEYTDFSGTTACGQSDIDTNNDHVVGLSSDLFGDGSLCGASITVTGPNGQSSTGTIVDSGADQINLSRVMFTEIEGSLDAGVFQGTYKINQNQKRANKVLVQYTEFDGETACGDYVNSKTDLVVGVSSDIFGDGSNCGRQVTITAPNGKSASGTLVDSGADQINLSEALFKKFYNLGKGQFTGTYSIQ